MTPLAAKIFRLGHQETQKELAQAQFFECSAIAAMAVDMRIVDGFGTGFSDTAQLPSPFSALEAVLDGRRMLFTCRENSDGHIEVNCIHEIRPGHIVILWQAAFVPGSERYRIYTSFNGDTKAQGAVLIGICIVEKLLCIINQPGLVERVPRETDKRVLRIASKEAMTPAPKWHECRIRPGMHGDGGAGAGTGREHQLHYVRKHFKPSLGRWIDGYWRGNADLGLYLKHYTVQAPGKAA